MNLIIKPMLLAFVMGMSLTHASNIVKWTCVDPYNEERQMTVKLNVEELNRSVGSRVENGAEIEGRPIRGLNLFSIIQTNAQKDTSLGLEEYYMGADDFNLTLQFMLSVSKDDDQNAIVSIINHMGFLEFQSREVLNCTKSVE